MNINIIIGIFLGLVVILTISYFLYNHAANKKREKIRRLYTEKEQRKEKKIEYKQAKSTPSSFHSKESIKNRIIIKKNREDLGFDKKDLISEAVSELDDLSATKFNIRNGQKNLTSVINIERDHSPFKILVVDDSKLFLKKAKTSLLNSGGNYEITTAIDGKIALEELKKAEFDLIVTDMDMPEMDGGELINCVKNDLVLSKIPIIVVTGQPKMITNGLENKVEGVLEKPYKEEDLIYQAQNALS